MTYDRFDLDVRNTGLVNFSDQNFSVRYCLKDFSSLHLYDYEAAVRIGNERFKVVPGDISLTPVGTVSSYHLEKPGVHYFAHFRLSHPHKILPLDCPVIYKTGTSMNHYRERFQLLARYLHGTNAGELAMEAAALVMKELLIRLHLEQNKAFPAELEPVSLAATYLEQNLECEIQIPEIADTVGLSPNYLAIKFRDVYGITMKRYLQGKRIESAKYLLRSSALTIRAIGKRVGIPDPHYFNKVFRKDVGMSPSQFRDGSSV